MTSWYYKLFNYKLFSCNINLFFCQPVTFCKIALNYFCKSFFCQLANFAKSKKNCKKTIVFYDLMSQHHWQADIINYLTTNYLTVISTCSFVNLADFAKSDLTIFAILSTSTCKFWKIKKICKKTIVFYDLMSLHHQQADSIIFLKQTIVL